MSDFPARPVTPHDAGSSSESAERPSSMLAQPPEAGNSEIDRLRARLAFYETFDDLIQQSVGRASQMIQEAAARREEATTTIVQVRHDQAVEREGQRAVLAELLDDVMTIQQATERLAHRVSEALEQVEFMIEPTGLPSAAHLESGGGLDRLGSGPRVLRTDAENVRDEVSAGAFSPTASAPSTGALPPFHAGDSNSFVTPPDPVTRPVDGMAADIRNPETAESDPVDQLIDTPQSMSDVAEPDDLAEPEPGGGIEAARVESSADTWSRAAGSPIEAVAGYEDMTVPAITTPDTSDDLVIEESPAADAAASNVADDNTDPAQPADDIETGSDLDLSMAEDESTSIVPDSDSMGGDRGTAGERDDAGANASSYLPDVSLESGVVADDVSRDTAAESPESTASTERGPSMTPAGALASAANRSAEPVMSAAASALAGSNSMSPVANQADPTGGTEASDSAAESAPAPVMEQRTTLIMNGVPRAAVALSIQRHILSRPEVLRAEVREYYDHRLTLSVTSERHTTIDDLTGWDPTADWETISDSDETLEVRLAL